MRRSAACAVISLTGAILLACVGCQAAGLRFLSLIGLQKDPLSIALVVNQPGAAAAAAVNPFPDFAGLQKALSDDLRRPVAVDLCFPFQVESELRSGWYELAVLPPFAYATLKETPPLPVLAVAVDEHGQAARGAVLVVPARSDIQAIAELRGKVVAFGPAGDDRTHHAALQLLQSAGLRETDLSLELLPVPRSLKHLPDMRSVAQTVINNSSDAGFIDEAAWNALPEHATKENEPARSQLRVIGRTVALPCRLVVASPKLDSATIAEVREFLLSADTKHPQALRPLRLSGYQPPTEAILAACRALRPPTSPPAEPPPP